MIGQVKTINNVKTVVPLSNEVATDSVDSGNMESVTSNAVALSKSYTLGEIDTGGTWIDGKRIYRRVDTWSLASLPIGSSTYTFSSSYWSTIDSLIDFRIVRPKSSTLIGAVVITGGYRFDPPTKTLNIYNNPTDWTGPFLIIAEYTKN